MERTWAVVGALLALSGVKNVGAVAPIGGAALIGGWLCLALAVWRA